MESFDPGKLAAAAAALDTETTENDFPAIPSMTRMLTH